MNKICGYSCEHNKGGVCQITMCDKKIVMTTTTNEPFEKRFNVKYDEQGVEKFTRWLDPTIEEYKKEINRLNNIIKELSKDVDMWNKKYNEQFNIINELEKWCLSWKENDKYCYLASNDKDKCRYDIWEEVLDKLKELKENNK